MIATNWPRGISKSRPRKMSTRWVAVAMLLVRRETWIIGLDAGWSVNSLLWQSVRSISVIGWLAVVAGLIQFGCRSAPQPVASEAVAPKAAEKADPRPVIVAFGDSLTAGFGAEPGSSFPDFLQKELDGWRVVNAGVSGDTTTDGANRVAEALSYHPRIVILEFGGNDGLRGLPLDTTRANLDQMLAAFKKAGVEVLLAGMTLPPNYGPEYIHGFEKIYVDLAAKYRVRRIPFLLEGVGAHADLMQRDGMHPTAAGNRKVAGTVMRYLRPMLGR
jgi:acyl-CoA thioesterase I